MQEVMREADRLLLPHQDAGRLDPDGAVVQACAPDHKSPCSRGVWPKLASVAQSARIENSILDALAGRTRMDMARLSLSGLGSTLGWHAGCANHLIHKAVLVASSGNMPQAGCRALRPIGEADDPTGAMGLGVVGVAERDALSKI
ncbi:hypothetical protein ASF43_23685 [Pseudorhodoferax sp. Leaf267]|nr:hypothetical protein ASF43_23685 [Pseudorhodoferax sp. Leaf267]